jgi:SpoVK/Ycf46/Vps4 family AAA+-type ATPase
VIATPQLDRPICIIDDIEWKKNLNSKQKVAYRIVTNHFIHCYILKDAHENPLRMLMTGPGGTGKTYIVNAPKEVMAAYRSDHKIRFLAPTGSAAALINGMTVHKGLGI